MIIKITIDTQNAAFEDYGAEELDTVLKGAKNFAALNGIDSAGSCKLLDSNGNTCGTIEIVAA